MVGSATWPSTATSHTSAATRSPLLTSRTRGSRGQWAPCPRAARPGAWRSAAGARSWSPARGSRWSTWPGPDRRVTPASSAPARSTVSRSRESVCSSATAMRSTAGASRPMSGPRAGWAAAASSCAAGSPCAATCSPSPPTARGCSSSTWRIRPDRPCSACSPAPATSRGSLCRESARWWPTTPAGSASSTSPIRAGRARSGSGTRASSAMWPRAMAWPTSRWAILVVVDLSRPGRPRAVGNLLTREGDTAWNLEVAGDLVCALGEGGLSFWAGAGPGSAPPR